MTTRCSREGSARGRAVHRSATNWGMREMFDTLAANAIVYTRRFLPTLLLAGLASCAGAQSSRPKAPAPTSPRIGEAMLAERARAREGDRNTGAGARSLVARRTKAREAKIDGRLDAGLRLEELGGGTKAAFTYDDEALHAFLRWDRAEAHRLQIAFPDERGIPIVRSVQFATTSGDEKATRAVDDDGKALEGVVVVDTEDGDGVEARIPWVLFPEGERTRVGLTVGVEASKPAPKGAKGASAKKASPSQSTTARVPVLTEPERALRDDLLRARLLPEEPLLVRVADLCGDEAKELVLVYPGILAIVGSAFGAGERFFYRELGDVTEVAALDVRPVTGRAKSDLILTLRQGSREWVEIESFLAGESPTMVFAQTVALGEAPARIVNRLRVGHERDVEVSVDPAEPFALEGDDYAIPSDVRPPLLPWGPTDRVLYRFDGKSFRVEREVARKTKASPVESKAAPTRAERLEHPAEPRSPFEQYLAERRLPATTTPARTLALKMSRGGEATLTQVGQDLVLHGPAIAGGRQYVRLSLPVGKPEEVLSIEARDLTGDGDDDVVVRIARDLRVEGQEGAVRSEHLVVYAVGSSTLARVFAAEVARQHGDKRVESAVRFAPKSIELGPGSAKGWSEATYGWAQEQPGGSLEPLVLPWSNLGKLRYEWQGERFVRAGAKSTKR